MAARWGYLGVVDESIIVADSLAPSLVPGSRLTAGAAEPITLVPPQKSLALAHTHTTHNTHRLVTGLRQPKIQNCIFVVAFDALNVVGM